MSAFLGLTEIRSAFSQSTPIKSIHVGSQQVWVADWFDQMEFYDDFTVKAVTATIHNTNAASGQAWVSNPGADSEAVGQIVASPVDGTHCLTSLDTGSDTSYVHNLTPDMGNRIVLQRVEFRHGLNTATDYQVLAVIAWQNWVANNNTTASPAHILFTRARTVPQVYADLAASAPIDPHVYTTAFTTEVQEAIIAVHPEAGAVVIVCPDGQIISYETTTATSLDNYSTGDFEIGMIAPSTDSRVEIHRVGACTRAGMTAEVYAAYDAILVSQGYGTAWEAPAGILQKSVTNFDTVAGSAPSPASVGGTHAGSSGTKRMLIATVQVSNTATSEATATGATLSTHTRTATYDGVAMTKVAERLVNDETDIPGYWIEKWILMDPPAGARNFNYQVSKAAGDAYRITSHVESWEGVGSYDAAVTAASTGGTTGTGGTSTNQYITVPSAPGNVVHHGFIAESAGSLTGYPGTVSRTQAQGTNRPPLLVGYMPGAASVVGSVVRATANSDVASIGINLKP